MTEAVMRIRVSHVTWWLNPVTDVILRLRAWRILSDSVAKRVMLAVLQRGLSLDLDEPVTGERRNG